MIVKDIKDLEGTSREVKGEGWISTRLLLKKDNMGFSMHETILSKNTKLKLHYQNHLEAVYCISGKGRVINLEDHKEYDIYPGVIYALDKNDRHILMSFKEDLRFVCVFNPPVSGEEKHDKNGSYPANDSREKCNIIENKKGKSLTFDYLLDFYHRDKIIENTQIAEFFLKELIIIKDKYKNIISSDNIIKEKFKTLSDSISDFDFLNSKDCTKITDNLIQIIKNDAIDLQIADGEGLCPEKSKSAQQSGDFFELKNEINNFYKKISDYENFRKK